MFALHVVILLSLITFSNCVYPEVKLSFGTVRGFEEKLEDEKEVDVFLGVPYAEPPVGPKRFQKPYPLRKKFDKVIEARKWPNFCMQPGKGQFSEDCLYLNIWSSVDLSRKLKPVMVFFPGGAFVEGGISNKVYNASKLSAYGGVVVVTVNYRLGSIGFMYGGNDEIPGNMGLYDQLLALQWVNKNIALFGGDKHAITIFGQSAGAISISLHLISPLSSPLFKKAIIMSGVSMEYWIVDSKKTALQKTETLSRLVGCNVTTHQNSLSKTTIKCLKKLDPKILIEAQFSPLILEGKRNPAMIPFLPIFNDSLVPIAPKQAWINSKFRKGSKLLIGTVPNDGIIAFSLASRYVKNKNSFIEIAEEYFSDFMTSAIPPFTNDVLRIYFKNLTKSDKVKSEIQFYHALSDILFNCPTVKFAEEFAKSNSAYQYLFDYEGAKSAQCKGFGPCHGDENRFTFGTTDNEHDDKISLRWIKILSEFAKSGTVPWPKYERTETNFLIPFYKNFFSTNENNEFSIGYRYLFCDYWNKIIFNNLQ